MQYLKEITIQSLIYLLFNSTNDFDLSVIEYEERINLFTIIYDDDLGDCFFFTLNENEAKIIINSKELLKDIKRARDTDNTFTALLKNIVKLKDKPINFLDIIKPNQKMLYELFFVSNMYILNIINSKKEKVSNYLRKYIENFKLNSLTSEANYYDFERIL